MFPLRGALYKAKSPGRHSLKDEQLSFFDYEIQKELLEKDLAQVCFYRRQPSRRCLYESQQVAGKQKFALMEIFAALFISQIIDEGKSNRIAVLELLL
jgi:hypothetical protein